MSVRYLDIADYIGIASELLELDEEVVAKVAKLDLADSALHAPSAGFGDDDFYPGFVQKAAVLIVHLAKNHPLPDGNKRAAWVSLRYFIQLNGWAWSQRPSLDESEAAVQAIAAGEWDEERTAEWLGSRITASSASHESD